MLLSVALPTSLVADDHMPKKLPTSIERFMHVDADHAIMNIAQQMMIIHPDGVINERNIEVFLQSSLAQTRARMMEPILRADLDFNGLITRDEMKVASNYRRGNLRERIKLELLHLDADVNGDGNLSLDEIRAFIVEQTKNDANKAEKSLMPRDFLALDIDGDNEVTIVEMARAIRDIQTQQQN